MPPNTRIIVRRDSVLINPDIQVALNTIIAEQTKELSKAKTATDMKYMEIGGDTGLPVGGVQHGAGDGYYRRYQNGTIYFKPPSGPCWVHGPILEKYVSCGAEGGFLGYPTTDEQIAPDGTGRYNHFERGSIYWTYSSGAHEIHGAIRDKWASLGWELGWLGYPISDESPYTQDGRVSVFKNGSIYWWPDTGAIDLGDIVVRYKGLYCFGETDEFSDADEPYVIFGLVPVPPVQPSEVMTQIYNDVDSGDCRPDNVELYRGFPGGIALGVALFEHDDADRDKYLEQVKQGVAEFGKAVGAGCGAVFGAEAAPVCEKLWKAVAPEIAKFLNKLLGTEDDLIAKSYWNLTSKDLVMLARAPRRNFWGIEYHLESELLSDDDASYKVYLDIEPV